MTPYTHASAHHVGRWPSLWLGALFLALFVTLWQVRCCGYIQLDLDWTYQRSANVIAGTAISPWQYRVLSHWGYRALTIMASTLGFDNPQHEALCIFRLVQNVAILALAALYYRRLGLTDNAVTVGLSMLAFGMLHTLHFSDMSFDTYSDVIFYLVAGLLILYQKPLWLLILMPLAALNRETSGLIPFMLLTFSFGCSRQRTVRIHAVLISILALVLYFAVFFGLRHAYGSRPDMGGHSILSKCLIVNNFTNEQSWLQLCVTMGLLPLLAVCSLRACPKPLQCFFWSIVPVWFLVHFVSAVVAETRLFLVPLAVALVPCMLFGLGPITAYQRGRQEGGTQNRREPTVPVNATPSASPDEPSP